MLWGTVVGGWGLTGGWSTATPFNQPRRKCDPGGSQCGLGEWSDWEGQAATGRGSQGDAAGEGEKFDAPEQRSGIDTNELLACKAFTVVVDLIL